MATPAAVSTRRPVVAGRAVAVATGLVLALAAALGVGVALGFALDDGGGGGATAGRVAEASFACHDFPGNCQGQADDLVAENCALDGVTAVRLTQRQTEAFGGESTTREVACP